MNAKEHTVFSILKAALKLFREKGFNDTSIREIASTAEVGLGMVNHYFGSKDFLGAQCLTVLSDYCMKDLNERIPLDTQTILNDLVGTRLLYCYLYVSGYAHFYRDSLENDIFFKYLSDKPTILIDLLRKDYTIEATSDEVQLYARYIPYMMEKTLVLKKDAGFFKSIDYNDVPFLIVQTAISHFIPDQEVTKHREESVRIADEMLQELSKEIPDDFLEAFVVSYVQKLQAANDNMKKNWIQTMNQIY